jgi:hydroxyethylthiazole kinase-like uncharacterized protein yjeF
MTPIEGRAILTAAAMRDAEAAAMTGDVTVDTLMTRAGEAVAAAVRRLAAGNEVLLLCGPGNNGGDGYVAAAALRRAGVAVRVAAAAEPRSDAARRARAAWTGPVEPLGEARAAPIVVDALFGTGLARPFDPAFAEPLRRLVATAQLAIAIDLPSGVATDTGEALGDVPRFHLTLALGAPKPAHLLHPGARFCGKVRVLDIGVPTASDVTVLDRPRLASPGPNSHKFSRGMVAIAAGSMAGASLLASEAAMRAGAGYVALLGPVQPGAPHALVRKPLDDHALADPRIGALLVGPGLGRDDTARATIEKALATDHPLVIDGDALHLVTPERLRARGGTIILTPHAGEFDALFGEGRGSKIDRARAAAAAAGATVVFKGADTVIAAPDGQVCIAGDANDWLSTAGTGDVLAGAIAAMLAAKLPPLDAAAAGVWLHGDAARRAGAAFIADDLAAMLTPARARL